MRPLVSGSCFALSLLFFLSQASYVQEQEALTNNTISWANPPSIFSKRTTCSGTCAECYGSGSIYCGTSDACFNPTIGESCCAQYSYSCPNGYYCVPGGLDMQCCDNTVSTDQCTQSISHGGGTGGGGLSTGAKAGIGIGVVLLLVIIAVAVFFFIRQRNNRRHTAPAPAAWQMPELSGCPGNPGPAPPGYNGDQGGGYDGAQGGHNVAQGGYNGTQQEGYDNNAQGGYDGAFGHPDAKPQFYGGGPPVAEVYTPGDGPHKAGYSGYVPSHVELPESHVVVSPAMSHTYPASTEQDRARAVEMYGGHAGQTY